MPVNQYRIFLAPSVFYFSDNSLIYAILRDFVLYSHYGDSSSRKKLNGHHAFGFVNLLEAFVSLLKQHILMIEIIDKAWFSHMRATIGDCKTKNVIESGSRELPVSHISKRTASQSNIPDSC